MSWESDHVQSAIAKRVPWSHIAKQVNRCEDDVRRRYGHLTTPTPEIEAADDEPIPNVFRSSDGLNIDKYPAVLSTGRNAAVTRLLARGDLTKDDISHALRCTDRQARAALGSLAARGLACCDRKFRPGLWALTTAGQDAADDILERGA